MRSESARVSLASLGTLKTLAILLLLSAVNPARAQTTVAQPEPKREICVPFEELAVILEQQPQRVLLSRTEYEELLAKARQAASDAAPYSAIPLSAEFKALLAADRAELVARVQVEVLRPGLHVVDLGLVDTGLRRATLDGQPAALGRDDAGRVRLFVEGVGRHELVLDLLAPLEISSALQTLRFEGPAAPARRMTLRVPGNVEIRSGASVVRRTFDEDAQITEFELVPPPGAMTLVMTLNSRQLQQQRVVIARGVLVDELTTASEQLHATFSLSVLHRPIESFTFALPDGFEVTEVRSPLLAQWSVATDVTPRVLTVQLREPTTGTVVLGIAALRTPPVLAAWSLPALRPLDVLGEATVIGVLLEDRLKLRGLAAERLIPIDASVLDSALPVNARTTALRAVAAFYAPTGAADAAVRADFYQPAAGLRATTNLLLTLDERELRLTAGVALRPEVDQVFAIDIGLPAVWHVSGVTNAVGQPLSFERRTADSSSVDGHVRIQLPQGIAPGEDWTLVLSATHVPAGWLEEWATTKVTFPALAVRGATRESGAIAVQPGEDLRAHPDVLNGLVPLDERAATRFGLTNAATLGLLTYRYDAGPIAATFHVKRISPRVTARVYTFLRLSPGVLSAHYELAYEVEDARARRLTFDLPASTPADVAVAVLGEAHLKEYSATTAGTMRHWTVLLAEPQRGTVRVAVDFEQPLSDADELDVPLPIARADNVVYQSGVVAVEGNTEQSCELATPARRVDVGELAGAEYATAGANAGSLGVFEYVGEDPGIQAHVARRPGFGLPPVVIQRLELTTLLSPDGISQTAARILLRAKTDYVEVELPPRAELWSAELDGSPLKPQREGAHLLLNLPGGEGAAERDLRIVYEMPADSVMFWRAIALPAPRLRVPGENPQSPAMDVPVADVHWQLNLPPGYRVVAHDGTVTPTEILRPDPAAWTVAQTLYHLAGGVNLLYGGLLPSLSATREVAKRAVELTEARSRASDARQTTRTLQSDISAPQALDAIADMETSAISAAKKVPTEWLEGVSSLRIEMETSDRAVLFQGLGGDARLVVTLAHWPRIQALCWAIALAVALAGLALTFRRRRTKTVYIITVILVATLIPLVSARPEWAYIANEAVYVAAALVPFYLIAATVRWVGKQLAPRRATAPAAAAMVVALLTAADAPAAPDDKPAPAAPISIQVVEPLPPIRVPDDAVIVPYDPTLALSDVATSAQAGPLLVPYTQYMKLWTTAFGAPPLGDHALPAPYALAGASYHGTLADDGEVVLEGQLHIDVYAEGVVSLPIRVAGGALTRALVDGQPARLGIAADLAGYPGFVASQVMQQRQRAEPVEPPPFTLRVEGPGRHRLDVTIRLPVQRRGGWRLASGRVPAAAATDLSLRVPEAGTDVALSSERSSWTHTTRQADEPLIVALEDGTLALKWRPRVQEGAVEASITADSAAVLDVSEDGLHLVWRLALDTGRTERDAFTLAVPADFTVLKINGTNVRGWSLRPGEPTATAQAREQLIEVTLLKPVRGAETLIVALQRGFSAADPPADGTFDAPLVRADGAALHRGQITIRRSSWFDLRTEQTAGLARADTPADIDDLVAQAADGPTSPLGVQPFASYRFAATPFVLRLHVGRRPTRPEASVRTVLRISDRQRTVESRIELHPAGVPVYGLRVTVPEELTVERITAPTACEWAVAKEDGQSVVAVFLATGSAKTFAITLSGTLGQTGPVTSVALPRIEVRDVTGQSGEIVAQVDPAFDVQSTDLKNCHEISLDAALGWLQPEQRPWARLALRYLNPDYAGALQLTVRTPHISCATTTNVRVTETAIEETLLLDFNVSRAGTRTLVFQLPAWLRDARITAPLLREKEIAATTSDPDAPLRVTLTLQEELMGQLRVLIEHDRILTAQPQAVPFPIVETGRTDVRAVAFENAGRDELVIGTRHDVEPLTRGQRQWDVLAALLGQALTEAYIATGPAPQLTYETRERVAVVTAGARIGLAEAVLVLDETGTYRAAQSYRVDNATEPYLEVNLPGGAELWTVFVAGQPAKPARGADPARPDRVRIPLIKTAAGDLDFLVTLHYGGHIALRGPLHTIQFPLLRTVNVPVELSQVQLHLPEGHAWFDFGGTTGRVAQAGDLAAGRVRYATGQTERLMKAMQGESEFGRVRASYNVQRQRADVVEFMGIRDQDASNEQLARELASHEQVARQATAQAQQIAGAAASQPADIDNRAKLHLAYEQQGNDAARDVVAQLGTNFVAEAPRSTGESTFDNKWLDKSALATLGYAGGQGEEAPSQGKVARRVVEKGGTADVLATGPTSPPLPQIAGKDGVPQSPASSRGPRKADAAERYKAQLREQTEEQLNAIEVPHGGAGRGRTAGRVAPMSQEVAPPGQSEASTQNRVEFPAVQSEGVAYGYLFSAQPRGLVSVTVELPVRGQAFLFTTPRGDVTITARATSHTTIATLEHASVVLAACAVTYAILRRRATNGVQRAATAKLLIVLGLASVVTGILPIAGVAAVIGGLALLAKPRGAAVAQS